MPGVPRDLAAVDPWNASLARSRARRARRARARSAGARRRERAQALASVRSLSAAHARQPLVRDLASSDLWELSLGRSRARRRAAELRFVPAGSRAKRLSLGAFVAAAVGPAVGLAEILHATFPGGSITGAPKLAAIDHVARLEPVGRGASMGALGSVRPNGDFELALTIRTFAVAAGRIHLWVGGGVVWDSEAEAEVEESWVKARPLLAAVGGLVPA